MKNTIANKELRDEIKELRATDEWLDNFEYIDLKEGKAQMAVLDERLARIRKYFLEKIIYAAYEKEDKENCLPYNEYLDYAKEMLKKED